MVFKLTELWKKSLFFNSFFVIVSDSSLQFMMSGILYYYFLAHSTKVTNEEDQGKFSDFNNFVSVIGFLCILFPSLLVCSYACILIPNKDWLNHKSRTDKIGSLYQQLKTSSVFSLSYNFSFFFRRLMLTQIFLFVQSYPGQQVQAILFLNLICLIQTGYSRPFRRLRRNRIENVNELLICMIGIILLTFTSFAPEMYEQYYMGWYYIHLLALLTMFNLLFLILDVFHSLKIIWIKYYRLIRFGTYDKP